MSLYDDLGVDKSASADDIKQGFKNQAKKHHTDKGGSHDKMTTITHAYSVLKSSTSRKRYDETGQEHNTPFDVEFAGLIQMVFMVIIEKNDIEHTDLIGELRIYLKVAINEKYKSKENFKKQLEKLIKVRGRLQGEKIMQVLDNNIVETKNQIALHDENIKFMKDCQEVIDHYNYKFDEVAPTEEVADGAAEWVSWSFNR